MTMRISGIWLRRALAHLTTPLVIALPWGLLLAERPWAGDLGGAIGLCYLGWLFLGLPGELLRKSHPPKPLWTYIAWGAATPAAALSLFGIGWRSGDWSLFVFVPICAAAAAWYWFCAYWRPAGRSGAEAAPG
jgi:hypothetical protein